MLIETTASPLEAFGIHEGEVISLVGGGGKTSLMFTLARVLKAMGKPVVTTTTTKILEPSPAETPLLLVEKDERKLLRELPGAVERFRHVTVASARLQMAAGSGEVSSPGGRSGTAPVPGPGIKLDGVRPEFIVALATTAPGLTIIVEADGSAGRPLKAPRETEPVIPANTTLVIPVVGVEAVGCRLTEECVLRAGIASRLLGLPLGEVVTAAHVATLITHPMGLTKGGPAGARIIPFINKADLDPGLSRSRELAARVLDYPGIDRVVAGQVRDAARPVVVMEKSCEEKPEN